MPFPRKSKHSTKEGKPHLIYFITESFRSAALAYTHIIFLHVLAVIFVGSKFVAHLSQEAFKEAIPEVMILRGIRLSQTTTCTRKCFFFQRA